MNKKIEELEKQIEIERRKMGNCSHKFGDAFYNPETYKKPYGSVQVGQGSDPYWVPQGYMDAEKPRWTRVCSECELEQHAYKKKAVIEKYEPDFGG